MISVEKVLHREPAKERCPSAGGYVGRLLRDSGLLALVGGNQSIT